MSAYRESQAPLRYLCIVCWKTASPVEGLCCGVPMPLAEDDSSIVDELRRRAKAKKDRPERRRLMWVSGVAAVLAVVLHAVLLWFGVYHVSNLHGGWGRRGPAGEVGIFVFVTFLLFMMALFYLTVWLSWFPPIDGAEKIDPDTTDVPTLLGWCIGSHDK